MDNRGRTVTNVMLMGCNQGRAESGRLFPRTRPADALGLHCDPLTRVWLIAHVNSRCLLTCLTVSAVACHKALGLNIDIDLTHIEIRILLPKRPVDKDAQPTTDLHVALERMISY